MFMKRLIVLLCAVLFISLSLCACGDDTAQKAKEKASEVMSGIENSMSTDYSNDNQGLLDDNRETIEPTNPTEDNTDGIYTDEGNMATEWDEMVENGEVDDGDGNIGKMENRDGDGNIDEDAVD